MKEGDICLIECYFNIGSHWQKIGTVGSMEVAETIFNEYDVCW